MQAGRRRPADLLAQYRRDGFVAPSGLDQRLVNTLDRLALEAAEGYDAVLLSPVAPLGVNSVVAPTSQDRTVTTTRGSEVVSDPTNVLALEAGCLFSIDTDAHAPGHFSFLDLGAARAEANGVPAERIVTTWPADRLLEWAGARR